MCKERSKKYYQEHRDQQLQYQKEYYAENRKKIRTRRRLPKTLKKKTIYQEKYRIKNREEILKYLREYYQKNKQRINKGKKEKINNIKRKAHCKLNNEVTKGNIKRQPCQICNNIKAEAHHDDYDKPLDVKWLCKSCHYNSYHKKQVE